MPTSALTELVAPLHLTRARQHHCWPEGRTSSATRPCDNRPGPSPNLALARLRCPRPAVKHLRVLGLALHVVPGDRAPHRARLVVLDHAGQRVRPDDAGDDCCLEAAVMQDDVRYHREPDPVAGRTIGEAEPPRRSGLSRASWRRSSLASRRLCRHGVLLRSRNSSALPGTASGWRSFDTVSSYAGRPARRGSRAAPASICCANAPSTTHRDHHHRIRARVPLTVTTLPRAGPTTIHQMG